METESSTASDEFSSSALFSTFINITLIFLFTFASSKLIFAGLAALFLDLLFTVLITFFLYTFLNCNRLRTGDTIDDFIEIEDRCISTYIN
ncbi:hypothetical protein F5B19DRAFT_468974 [Rostrohypoxylon terebratum]|nr:hypothetical protein F5B19DRAFT_468974 [Rostrohypoxylon terebratum]